jgi:predicted HAD superfamily phosphohydrolase YqeG
VLVLEEGHSLFTVNHARTRVAMENGKHDVRVLENESKPLHRHHVRTMEAMEISKHDVPVLEVGQNLFTISNARNNGDDGDRTR